jgi:hypothetical protein
MEKNDNFLNIFKKVIYFVSNPNNYKKNNYIVKNNFRVFDNTFSWEIPKPKFLFYESVSDPKNFIDFELEIGYINILKLK